MINQHFEEFVEAIPSQLLHNDIKKHVLYAIGLLDDLNVRLDGIEYAYDSLMLHLPVVKPFFGQSNIHMKFYFQRVDQEDKAFISIGGPYTSIVSEEKIYEYINSLEKRMSKNGETIRNYKKWSEYQ